MKLLPVLLSLASCLASPAQGGEEDANTVSRTVAGVTTGGRANGGAGVASATGLFFLPDVDGLTFDLEAKTVDTDSSLGFDFDLAFERRIGADEGIAGTRLSFALESRGYVATNKVSSHNSVVTKARVWGHIFQVQGREYSPAQVARVREILADPALDPLDDAGIVPELKEFFANQRGRYLSFDLHAGNEAEQDFSGSQLTIGFGAAFDVETILGARRDGSEETALGRLLDMPFALFRDRNASVHHKSSAPRFYVGYDFIPASDVETRGALTTDDTFHRLQAEVAWGTLVFERLEVKIAGRVYYEPDAPPAIRAADMSFATFAEMTVAFPVDRAASTKLFVKYTTGRVAPTLAGESVASLGFSIDLGQSPPSRD